MRHIVSIISSMRRAVGDQKGVTAVEYAVIGALIIVGAVTAITQTGDGLEAAFGNIAGALRG
ncbi:MAG: Flp/Fap pilin component [Pseudomonadota bacterium]|jgi:pilus assembly protein Flp/PilA